MGRKLRDLAVNDTIKFMFNGVLREFVIMQKGNPDPGVYNSTFDDGVYLRSKCTVGKVSDYEPPKDQRHNSWYYKDYSGPLNQAFRWLYKEIEKKIDSVYVRSKIRTVNLPCYYGYYNANGTNLLTLDEAPLYRIFFPSLAEFNIGTNRDYKDGCTLDGIEKTSTSTKECPIINDENGKAENYILRSTMSSTSSNDYIKMVGVSSTGSANAAIPTNTVSSWGLVMCFVMDDDVEVDEDNTIIVKKSSVPLKDLPVLSPFSMLLDDTKTWFTVRHQGNPDTLFYGSEFNDGTWVILETLEKVNQTSAIAAVHPILSSSEETNTLYTAIRDFYNRVTDPIKPYIKQVRIPYMDVSSINSTAYTIKKLSSGAPVYAFALSHTEMGLVNAPPVTLGATLDGCSVLTNSTDSEVGDNNGPFHLSLVHSQYWLRSYYPYTDNFGYMCKSSDYDGPRDDKSNYALHNPCMIIKNIIQVTNSGELFVPPFMQMSVNNNNFGPVQESPSVRYEVSIADESEITTSELYDGRLQQTRIFSNGSGAQSVDWLNAPYFLRIPNDSSHTITVEATSIYGETVSVISRFTKSLHECVISHKTGFECAALAAVAALRLIGDIPADVRAKIELTNNYKDAEPVWEDATSLLLSGDNYAFTNKAATAGNWYNFRVTLARGISGTPGKLYGIAGTFQGADE